jgi:hypothetical protein
MKLADIRTAETLANTILSCINSGPYHVCTTPTASAIQIGRFHGIWCEGYDTGDNTNPILYNFV